MKWKWYKPKDPTPQHQCPCCDYITLPERGNYLICPICFWEDDGLDLDNRDTPSGANRMTLTEGRANFVKFGACELKMVENVIAIGERNNYKLIKRT